MFKAQAGVNMTHVPYKGGGESLLSAVSGEAAVYYMSSTIIGNQPEEYGAFVKSEVDTLAKLVTKLNLTAESIR